MFAFYIYTNKNCLLGRSFLFILPSVPLFARPFLTTTEPFKPNFGGWFRMILGPHLFSFIPKHSFSLCLVIKSAVLIVPDSGFNSHFLLPIFCLFPYFGRWKFVFLFLETVNQNTNITSNLLQVVYGKNKSAVTVYFCIFACAQINRATDGSLYLHACPFVFFFVRKKISGWFRMNGSQQIWPYPNIFNPRLITSTADSIIPRANRFNSCLPSSFAHQTLPSSTKVRGAPQPLGSNFC